MHRCGGVYVCVRAGEITHVFESTGRVNGDKSAVTAEYSMCTAAWVLAVHLFPCEAASLELEQDSHVLSSVYSTCMCAAKLAKVFFR